eukprot:jgi/Hompol1/7000/HPOL_005153-RA
MASRLATPFRRAMSSVSNGRPFPPYEQVMLKDAYAARHHAEGSVKTWYWINLLLVAPALIASGIYVIPNEMEHIKHKYEHPNEYVPFQHLRKLKNPFPWGFDPLFDNKAFVPGPPRDE